MIVKILKLNKPYNIPNESEQKNSNRYVGSIKILLRRKYRFYNASDDYHSRLR